MIPLRSALTLFGGFLLHITLGTGYTFGNMSPYIISYLHAHGDNYNVTANDAIWIQSLIVVGQGLFMSIGGIIDNYAGPRVTSYLGSLLASIGIAVSYFSIKVSLSLMALTYGFVFGSGIGLAYTSPLSAGMKWFPNNKGLANGIIVCGFGLGSFIFTQVQTAYLNPHNSMINENGYFTDPYMLNHVPNIFLLLAAIYASLQMVSCALLYLPDKEFKEVEPIMDLSVESSVDLHYGSVEKILNYDLELFKLSPGEASFKDDVVLYQSFTPKQIIRYRQFYILWLTFFFNSQLGNYITSMYKSYGQTFIKDDHFLAVTGAVAALFNAGGRIIWGLLIDKFNYKICMLALTAGLCIFTSTLTLTPNGGKYMYAVWIWFIFFFFSGNFSLLPTCTSQTFGTSHAGINYGLIFSSVVISSPMSAILTQNLSSIIGWNGIIGLFGGFVSISFLLTLFFKELQHV